LNIKIYLKKAVRIFLKSILVIALMLLAVVVLAYYAIQLPVVQTRLVQEATKKISEKLGGTVSIGKAKITWLDEMTFEDVLIKDLKGRDMIALKEIYINSKTNFSFNPKDIIKFDNNLDYIMLKNPNFKLVKEENGELNFDRWLAKINKLANPNPKPSKTENNKPFSIDNAYIQNGVFTLKDPRVKRFSKDQFDYNNFTFSDLNVNLENFFIQGDTIKFKAPVLKAVDKRSGLKIKDLKANFFYCKSQMELSGLNALINNSVLKDYIGFFYERPSAFNHFNSQVRMLANLKDCKFDAQDIALFAPELYKYKEVYKVNTKLSGTVENLSLTNLDFGFGSKSKLIGNVLFKGLPHLKTTKFDVNLKNGTVFPDDIRQYVDQKTYTEYVTKVGNLSGSGTFNGYYNNFVTKANLQSSGIGNVNGDITMKISPESSKSTYFGNLDMQEIDLAKITGSKDLLKTITFSGKIQGSGLGINDAKLNLNGKVAHIWFNGYDYKNINVNGDLGQSIFLGNISIKDPNLIADVNGKVDFNNALNTFKIKGLIDKVKLKPIGLADTDIELHTQVNLDFEGNKLDNWVGRAQFLNTFFKENKKNLVIDSLFINSAITESGRRLSFVSEFFNGYVSGGYVPSELINDLSKLVKEYKLYFTGNELERKNYYLSKSLNPSTRNYSANYKLYFKHSEPFFAFFKPEIYVSPGSELGGKVSIRNTSEFSLQGRMDTLRYDSNNFYDSEIDVNSSKTALSPEVLTSIVIQSKNQKFAGGIETEKLNLSGVWDQSNVIEFDANIKQSKTTNKAQIFGKLNILEEGFDVSFNSKNSKLTLLDNKWRFLNENLINFKGDEICFQNLSIYSQNQSLSIDGTISKLDSTAQTIVKVHDFDLKTLQPIANINLAGIANGEIKMSNLYGNPLYTSHLYVDEMLYKNVLIGTVAAEALWDNLTNKLNINSNINRINNEIFRLTGTYDPKNSRNPLNLKASLKKANIEIFGSFVDSFIADLGGFASGTLSIKGQPSDPIIRGEIAFEKASLKIKSLGSNIYFDDKIIFNEEGFVAPNDGFKVRDAAVGGNLATIQGGVFNGGSGNFMLGLHAYFKSKDGFKILNTTINDNESFYGAAFASGDLHVTGTFENVNIAGNLSTKKNTKITIPLDGSMSINTEVEAIPFIGDLGPKKDSLLTKNEGNSDVNLNGLKMAFNFTITPDAECEIIFDRANNDKLNAFGNGRISIVYDTRGGFTMNGPYVVKSGKYNFSFQNLASLRKFNIKDGSRITWSGDPYDAIIDMDAVYTLNIPLKDIPNVSLSSNSSEQNVRYPVNVTVNMSDKLMIPKISYQINFEQRQIPVTYQTQVQAFEQRLKDDEQLLSRNVSSLLLFNQIFPENDLVKALGQQFLIDNISGILSNQIGNFANKLDENLELGVQLGDIGQNLLNNFQFNFSYRLLNNRVRLSGKSSYNNGLNADNALANQGQLSVGGEIEYLLSEDGSLRMKFSSRTIPYSNYFFNTTSGNVLSSGASVQFSRNFNYLLKKYKANSKVGVGVGTKPAENQEPIKKIDSLLVKNKTSVKHSTNK
jgi:hypothetical protein